MFYNFYESKWITGNTPNEISMVLITVFDKIESLEKIDKTKLFYDTISV